MTQYYRKDVVIINSRNLKKGVHIGKRTLSLFLSALLCLQPLTVYAESDVEEFIEVLEENIDEELESDDIEIYDNDSITEETESNEIEENTEELISQEMEVTEENNDSEVIENKVLESTEDIEIDKSIDEKEINNFEQSEIDEGELKIQEFIDFVNNLPSEITEDTIEYIREQINIALDMYKKINNELNILIVNANLYENYEKMLETNLKLTEFQEQIDNFGLMILSVETPWDGYSIQKPNGTGTEIDPYLISNGAELAWVANEVNNRNDNANFQDEFYKLTSNIDLCNHEWTPIGDNYAQEAFQGNFIGSGFIIENLNVSSNKEAGLFGYVVNATICDLTINNASIYGKYAGAFIGTTSGNPKLCNLHVTNSTINGNYAAGGVLGQHSTNSGCTNGIICSCSVENTTINSNSNGNVGGIIGQISGSNGVFAIENTVCKTSIIKGYSGSAGGILGSIANGQSNTSATINITNCYNASEIIIGNPISGYNNGTGGIIGSVKNGSSTINYCYNIGNLKNTSSNKNSYIGGIVGYAPSSTTKNSVNFGIISSTNTSTTNKPTLGTINGYGNNAQSCWYIKDCINSETKYNTIKKNGTEINYADAIVKINTLCNDSNKNNEVWLTNSEELPILLGCISYEKQECNCVENQQRCICYCTTQWFDGKNPNLNTTITIRWKDGYTDTPIKIEIVDIGISDKELKELYPNNPSRDGYVFDGWDEPTVDEDGNITITAIWKEESKFLIKTANIVKVFVAKDGNKIPQEKIPNDFYLDYNYTYNGEMLKGTLTYDSALKGIDENGNPTLEWNYEILVDKNFDSEHEIIVIFTEYNKEIDNYIWTKKMNSTMSINADEDSEMTSYFYNYYNEVPQIIPNKISWYDEDLILLEFCSFDEDDEEPAYSQKLPTKESDSKYDYVFKEWIKQETPLNDDDISYVASYDAIPKTFSYTITHEYYTDGILDGFESNSENAEIDSIISESDITRNPIYDGNTYKYISITPSTLQIQPMTSLNEFVLRYDRYSYKVIHKYLNEDGDLDGEAEEVFYGLEDDEIDVSTLQQPLYNKELYPYKEDSGNLTISTKDSNVITITYQKEKQLSKETSYLIKWMDIDENELKSEIRDGFIDDVKTPLDEDYKLDDYTFVDTQDNILSISLKEDKNENILKLYFEKNEPIVSESPSPSPSNKPVESEEPSESPKPSDSPKPSESPTVSESSSPSPSVEPSEEPFVSPSVKPSGNPKPSDEPIVSEKPSESPTVSVQPSKSPVVSEKPSQPSESPKPSETPTVSKSPTVSEKPSVSPTPTVSNTPNSTPTPNVESTPNKDKVETPIPSTIDIPSTEVPKTSTPKKETTTIADPNMPLSATPTKTADELDFWIVLSISTFGLLLFLYNRKRH